MEIQESITHYPPFNRIGDDGLKDHLDDRCSLSTIPSFTLVTEKGKPIDRIGYILSGTIDLLGDSGKGEILSHGSLGKGAYFGIGLLLNSGFSLLDEITMEPVSCLTMDRETFLFVLRRCPSLKPFFESALIDQMRKIPFLPDDRHPAGSPGEYRRLKRSMDYIDSHYMENISLDDLARITGLSRYHFSRLFNQVTGHTFKDYLNLKRLAAAKKLLKLPEINISQACFSVGFNDASYFARLFRKYEGMSPSLYRREDLPCEKDIFRGK